MGKEIIISNKQFYSNVNSNLIGTPLSFGTLDFDIEIGWSSNSSSSEHFNVFSDRMTRGAGSFLADGWGIGHIFGYINNWSSDPFASHTGHGEITAISSDGKIIWFTTLSGIIHTGDRDNIGIRPLMDLEANFLYDVKYKYCFADNSDISEVIIDLQTNDTPTWNFKGVGIPTLGVRSLDQVSGVVGTKNKSWVFDNEDFYSHCGFLTNTNNNYYQKFSIKNSYWINPIAFYDTGIATPIFAYDENSIKYKFEVEFFRDFIRTSPSVKYGEYDNKGYVGWYNEYLNTGNSGGYAIQSLIMQDDLGNFTSDVFKNQKTNFSIIVNAGEVLLSGAEFYLAFFRIPNSESEYQQTLTTFDDNFMLAINPHNSISTIKYLTRSSNDFIALQSYQINGHILFTNDELARISEGDRYVFALIVYDSIGYSNTLVLRDGVFDTSINVNFLLEDTTIEIFDHPTNYIDNSSVGVTDPSIIVEDGFLSSTKFKVDTIRATKFNSMAVGLYAKNKLTNKDFLIDEYSFDCSSFPILNNRQLIELDQNRGYNLPENSQFNFAKVSTNDFDGRYQNYSILLGQKANWQDWIFNSNVDLSFYDKTKPNNNLNEKTSNYNSGDWQIFLKLTCNVQGLNDNNSLVIGNTDIYSAALNIRDYGDYPNVYHGNIQTYTADGLTNLNGNILTNGQDTLFRCRWDAILLPTVPNPFDSFIRHAAHRIEIKDDITESIEELTTHYKNTNGLLKPYNGSDLLDIQYATGQIITSCLIDGSKVKNRSYKLSARLQDKPLSPVAMYSLVPTISGITNNATVRRSSDNTTLAVGTLTSGLDTTAEVFCAGTDGFITRLEDLASGAYPAAQATSTAQAKIISTGVFIKTNSILNGVSCPHLEFDNSNDAYTASLPNNTNLWVIWANWSGVYYEKIKTNPSGATTLPTGAVGRVMPLDFYFMAYFVETENIESIFSQVKAYLTTFLPYYNTVKDDFALVKVNTNNTNAPIAVRNLSELINTTVKVYSKYGYEDIIFTLTNLTSKNITGGTFLRNDLIRIISIDDANMTVFGDAITTYIGNVNKTNLLMKVMQLRVNGSKKYAVKNGDLHIYRSFGDIEDLIPKETTAMTSFNASVGNNIFHGNLPNLAGNIAMTTLRIATNQITGVADDFQIPLSFKILFGSSNAFTLAAITKILQEFVDKGIINATIQLNGGTSAIASTDPTCIALRNIIISRGGTVLLN